MEYRLLGHSGLLVSRYALGTLMLGRWGNGDHRECVRIIHAAADAGINLIDTADVYSDGESEEIVGQAVRGRRDRIVVATKVGWTTTGGPVGRGSRAWIRNAVESSLQRLGTDYIDLCQLHRPDPSIPIEESLGVLGDLIAEGKVRCAGTSNSTPNRIAAAVNTYGRARLAAEQAEYSMFNRTVESNVLPAVEHGGLGFIAWGPLAGGWLAGRYRNGTLPIDSRGAHARVRGGGVAERFRPDRPANHRKHALVELLAALASQAELRLVAMALAFPLEHPAVTSVLMGPRTLDQLRELLSAMTLRMPAVLAAAIDELLPQGTAVDPLDQATVPSN